MNVLSEVIVVVVSLWILEGNKVIASCNMTSPCRLVGELLFVQPRQVHSTNGFLRLNLSVDVTELKLDWLTVRRRSYNREIPGPTWRIKPGDTVNLTLTNRLTTPDYFSQHNSFQLPNHTNIHTHGLHISGMNSCDNVFLNVTPDNGQYHYTYPILSYHSPGTYWYHPHLHGSVNLQTYSGMSGMIIVEDSTDFRTPQHIQDVSCPNNCKHDIQLVFQPLLMYSKVAGTKHDGFAHLQVEMHDPLFSLNRTMIKGSKNESLFDWVTDETNGVNNFTTNGLLNPVLNLTTGEIKRFRMVNAGTASVLELYISDEHYNSACDFYEIAIDGIYLDQATPPRFGKSFLVPASRVDWLVVCNKPGTYYLKSYAPEFEDISTGEIQRINGTLLTIVVSGPTTTTSIQRDLPRRPDCVSDFQDLTQEEVHGRFVIEAGSGYTLNRELFKSEEFWRYNVEVDTVQEWYLTNTDTKQSHPIHIHVNSFQVISYNPYTGPFDSQSQKYWSQDKKPCFFQHQGYNESMKVPMPKNPLKYLGHNQRWKNGKGGPETIGLSQPGVFRDVILVPPLSNITIRFKTDKFIGTVVIHCHILPHEDLGMMMTVNILPKGSDLNQQVSVKSGNAYPGTCNECDAFPFNAESPCNGEPNSFLRTVRFH